jgi:hypothetical protein
LALRVDVDLDYVLNWSGGWSSFSLGLKKPREEIVTSVVRADAFCMRQPAQTGYSHG